MVNGFRYYRALESISFIYRSYHLPMPDQSPSMLTVYTPTSYSSEEGVTAGHSGQFTPMRLPVNTMIHTTLESIEPATFRSLVRRAARSATEPTIHR